MILNWLFSKQHLNITLTGVDVDEMINKNSVPRLIK